MARCPCHPGDPDPFRRRVHDQAPDHRKKAYFVHRTCTALETSCGNRRSNTTSVKLTRLCTLLCWSGESSQSKGSEQSSFRQQPLGTHSIRHSMHGVHAASIWQNRIFVSAMASINVQRNRLYLLARLPLKDGSPGRKAQRIALYLDDTPANQRTARKRLAVLEKQLANATFEWSYWQPEHLQTEGVTWNEGIRRLHHKKVILGRTGESTWKVNYMGRLRQIKGTDLITSRSIEVALLKYERSQCSYKELYYLLKHIAALVGVPFPAVPVPTYDQHGTPDVPSDDEILAWIEGANEPAAWYFGVMATYGLRPHEIETARFLEGDRLEVAADTKTGARIVIPLPATWVERFALTQIRRRQGTSDLARHLWRETRKLGLPWKPYALRHAYAARLWRLGGRELDLFTAARLMGHSVERHIKTYRSHIDPNTIAVAAEEAIARNLGKER